VLLDAAAELVVRVPHDFQIPPPVGLGVGLGQRHALEATELEAELARVARRRRGRRPGDRRNPQPRPAERTLDHVLRLALVRHELADALPRDRLAAVAGLGAGVEVDHGLACFIIQASVETLSRALPCS
ncbi:MAG: hypothetical protein ACK55I_16805, partial [bacterium]